MAGPVDLKCKSVDKEDEIHFNNDFHYLFNNDDTIDIRPTESGKLALGQLVN